MPNVYRDTAVAATPTPPLDGDGRFDVVVVVGGGFTGLSTALHLAEKGARVAVLEAQEPGWGASGRNGGQVNPGLKHDPDLVERDFGEDLGGRMNALAGGAAMYDRRGGDLQPLSYARGLAHGRVRRDRDQWLYR